MSGAGPPVLRGGLLPERRLGGQGTGQGLGSRPEIGRGTTNPHVPPRVPRHQEEVVGGHQAHRGGVGVERGQRCTVGEPV